VEGLGVHRFSKSVLSATCRVATTESHDDRHHPDPARRACADHDGTDNIQSIHDELAALVDAGLTPLEALRAATVEPARFLNTAAVSGLVKPGFQADVVLIKGNPLVDIGNTRRVAGVVLRGKYHQVSAVAAAR
jgi:adenine deaminase